MIRVAIVEEDTSYDSGLEIGRCPFLLSCYIFLVTHIGENAFLVEYNALAFALFGYQHSCLFFSEL